MLIKYVEIYLIPITPSKGERRKGTHSRIPRLKTRRELGFAEVAPMKAEALLRGGETTTF